MHLMVYNSVLTLTMYRSTWEIQITPFSGKVLKCLTAPARHFRNKIPLHSLKSWDQIKSIFLYWFLKTYKLIIRSCGPLWPIYTCMWGMYCSQTQGMKIVGLKSVNLKHLLHVTDTSMRSPKSHIETMPWLWPSAWKCNRKNVIPEREAQSCSSAEESWHCCWNGPSSLGGLWADHCLSHYQCVGAEGADYHCNPKKMLSCLQMEQVKPHCADKPRPLHPLSQEIIAQLGICSMAVTWTLNTSQDVLPDVFQKHLGLPVFKCAPFCWSCHWENPEPVPAMSTTAQLWQARDTASALKSIRCFLLLPPPAEAKDNQSLQGQLPGRNLLWQKMNNY